MLTKRTGDNFQTSINIRVGKKFREKYDKYLSERDISGASFTRDAIDYWMSVDGKPGDTKTALNNAELENQHLRELLSEKERTISILQDQIQLLNVARGHVQVNGNKNSKITAVAEHDPKYLLGSEK